MSPKSGVGYGSVKLHLSLRVLIVCVAVLSVWLGIYMHRVRTQAAALQGMRAAGGTLIYESDSEWGAGQRIVRRQFDSWPSVRNDDAAEMDDYYRVIAEVEAVTHGPAEDKEYGTLRARVLRQRLLVRTLGRIIELCKSDTLPRELEQQRPVVEAFTRRIAGSDVSRSGRFREFVDFLAVMDSNDSLRRLYAAASDFVFADIIDAYLQYLDRQLQNGPLTDVERDEWAEGRESLRTCLRNASGQLTPETKDQADEPSEQIRRIWRQTRAGGPHDDASRVPTRGER